MDREKGMPKKLTAKQQRFVSEYGVCGNATEAARRAGYKGNDETLAQVGSENLRKPYLAIKVKQQAETRRKKSILTRDQRQQILSRIALGQAPREALGHLDITVKNMLSALDQLAKADGDYIQKIEHSGPGGGPITVRPLTKKEMEEFNRSFDEDY